MNQSNRNANSPGRTETATLGGGCFWCLEPLFEELEGVLNVVVGYAGGMTPDPDYRQVCTGTTGHAEVVQITFDPDIISYQEILEVFFSIHDPTTLNRQGADVGTQYRSIILYHDQSQKEIAEAVMREMTEEGIWQHPVVTEVLPYQVFYEAEEYHQEYFRKNPYQGYCAVVISPKLSKFRKKFRERLKEPQA